MSQNNDKEINGILDELRLLPSSEDVKLAIDLVQQYRAVMQSALASEYEGLCKGRNESNPTISRIYLNKILGLRYQHKWDMPKAVYYFQKVYDDAQKLQDVDLMINASTDLATIKTYMHDFTEAIKDYHLALQRTPKESKKTLQKIWNGIGDGHLALKEYDKAIEAQQQSYSYAESNCDKGGSCLSWGMALRGRGRYDEAIEKLEEAIEMGDNGVKARSMQDLAIVYLNKAIEIGCDSIKGSELLKKGEQIGLKCLQLRDDVLIPITESEKRTSTRTGQMGTYGILQKIYYYMGKYEEMLMMYQRACCVELLNSWKESGITSSEPFSMRAIRKLAKRKTIVVYSAVPIPRTASVSEHTYYAWVINSEGIKYCTELVGVNINPRVLFGEHVKRDESSSIRATLTPMVWEPFDPEKLYILFWKPIEKYLPPEEMDKNKPAPEIVIVSISQLVICQWGGMKNEKGHIIGEGYAISLGSSLEVLCRISDQKSNQKPKSRDHRKITLFYPDVDLMYSSEEMKTILDILPSNKYEVNVVKPNERLEVFLEIIKTNRINVVVIGSHNDPKKSDEKDGRPHTNPQSQIMLNEGQILKAKALEEMNLDIDTFILNGCASADGNCNTEGPQGWSPSLFKSHIFTILLTNCVVSDKFAYKYVPLLLFNVMKVGDWAQAMRLNAIHFNETDEKEWMKYSLFGYTHCPELIADIDTNLASPLSSPRSTVKSPSLTPVQSPRGPIKTPTQSPIHSPRGPIKTPIQSPIHSPRDDKSKYKTSSTPLQSPINSPRMKPTQ